MDFKASELGVPSFSTQAQGTQAPGTTHHKKPKQSPDHASQALTIASAGESASSSKAASSNLGIPTPVIGIAILVLPIVLIWLLIRIFRKSKPGSSATNTQPQTASSTASAAPRRASYAIPHCDFEETADGFIVTFRKLQGSVKSDFSRRGMRSKSSETSPILSGLMAAGNAAYLMAKPTRIVVTRDAVNINGDIMDRRDFAGFHCTTIEEKHANYVRLAYTFGNENKTFGGDWNPGEGNAIASALNQRLHATPMAGDEHNPSPDALRGAARPTEF